MDSTRCFPGAAHSTVTRDALRSARPSTVALLVFLPLVAWLWMIVMARDMYGPMTGASAWMMTPNWDVAHLLLLWAMWAVMMTAMMLPSASPLVLLYSAVAQRSAGATSARGVTALAIGYIVVWAAFSLGATMLQRALARALVLSPMMEVTSPRVGALLLVVAGMYQLTPIKHSCLRSCQSPLGFLLSRWRSGSAGAFRLGLEHGVHCVGCCWALMLLLFAGGVMNLIVIAALTAFVAFEKLAPVGVIGARISGVLLITAGFTTLAR